MNHWKPFQKSHWASWLGPYTTPLNIVTGKTAHILHEVVCWNVEEQHLLLGRQKTSPQGGFFLDYGCFPQENQFKEDIRESWLCFNHWQTQQLVYTINQFVTHHSVHWKYCDRCSSYCTRSWQQMGDTGILPSKIKKFPGLFIQHVTFPLRSVTYKIVLYSTSCGYFHLAFPLS